jgi:hypothetical protein
MTPDSLFSISNKVWSWNNDILRADSMLSRGHVKNAFELLGPCFDALTPLLRDANPITFIYVYLASLKLSPEIGKRLLLHAVNLCKTGILEDSHPVRLMLTRLGICNGSKAQADTRHMIFAYQAILEASGRWCAKDILMLQDRSIGILASIGVIEYASLEMLFQEIAGRLKLEASIPAPTSIRLENQNVCVMNCTFAWYPWRHYVNAGVDRNHNWLGEQVYSGVYEELGPDHRVTRFVRGQLQSYCRRSLREGEPEAQESDSEALGVYLSANIGACIPRDNVH